MDTWTKQSGFPVVSVVYDSATRKIKATQSLYKPSRTDDQSSWPDSPFR